MKKALILAGVFVFALLCNSPVNAQGVSINDDGAEADPSAILDIKSSQKGMLIPRMTTAEMQAIHQPADGLQVYNTEEGIIYIYVGSSHLWKEVSYGAGTLTPAFICGDDLYDYRDGKSYATVEINGVCWMAENLNYGVKIGYNTNQQQQADEIVEKYCYNNSETYCDNFGGLYQWNEMMGYTTADGSQGICPDSWHVSTDQEWFNMENFIDPSIYNINQTGWRGNSAGNKLKKAGVGPPYNWNGPNYGTNETGFTAIPGGIRVLDGYTNNSPYYGTFWTSTQNYGNYAIEREMRYNYSSVYRSTAVNKYYGMSVRCIKN